MNEIVSAEWLHQHLNDPDLILLDSSLEATVTGSQSEYMDETLPEARFFDLKNNFSDPDSPFPNSLPSTEQFERESRKLGIETSSRIVVFDNMGTYSSPRVWWMFRVMGHDNISVLDGGLPEWRANGFLTEKKRSNNHESGNFKAEFKKELVKKYEDIVDNLKTKSFNVIDARSEGRFNGTENEPRKHLQSGHIPESFNIPYGEVLENGKFKSRDELKSIFESKGIDDQDLVFSCGSGLTACIILLASEIAFKRGGAVYDGSWTEWAELQNLKENSP